MTIQLEYVYQSSVAIFPSYYAGIMPKLCWHNRLVPTFDDTQLMQSDLDTISGILQWSLETKLFFNESKFVYIHYWAKPSTIDQLTKLLGR